jgi:radical S-adenosyl methionine domain-containing protein 2
MLSAILVSNSISIDIIGASFIISCAAYLFYSSYRSSTAKSPVSVNYHFSRKCNYECGFCFHTEKTSSVLSPVEAKRGMKLSREAGMEKLNLAGGEPFLYPTFMHELLRYGKVELGIPSISIVSNGSKITERFLRENAALIDILAISCDSFDPKTNIKIGRGRSGKNVEQLTKIAGWCQQYGIKFKINTVVCSLNWDEDMTQPITEFQPFRWKAFQCLVVTGENDNEQRKRDARSFLVTDEQWKVFCDRHKHLKCFVPESNKLMKDSYLVLDEYMRFLDKGDGEEKASDSILNVGVREAMTQVRWNRTAFVERGGFYDWTRASEAGCRSSGGDPKNLEW